MYRDKNAISRREQQVCVRRKNYEGTFHLKNTFKHHIYVIYNWAKTTLLVDASSYIKLSRVFHIKCWRIPIQVFITISWERASRLM
jgi:hypothetical protein